jgi:hypothetical protein
MAAAVAAGGVTIEALQAILSDHAYGALAICRHGDPAAAGADRWDDTATRASVLMAPAEGTLHVADGQPCRAPYEAFTLG